MAAVLGTDALTQRGFAHAIFYLPCVLLAALTCERRWLLAVSVTCVVLAGAGLALSPPAPPGFPLWQVVGNQLGSMVLLVAAAAIAWHLLGLNQRMRTSHDAFVHLAESMPLIVWSATPDGRMDFFNQALLDQTGSRREEFDDTVGIDPIVHPDDRAPLRTEWRQARHAGRPVALPIRIRDRTGGFRWHMIQAEPVRNGAGAIVRWYGSGADIHDRTVLAEQAEGLARRLTTTLESVTDAFLLLDDQWRVVFVNSCAEHLLDRRREELLNVDIWQQFPEAVGSEFERRYRQAALTGKTVEFEAPFAPLGKVFWVKAFPSEEGLALYFQDITARRESEAQLRLLETAVSHIEDIILITEARPVDGDGPKIVFVNDAFERHTGWRREEVLGRTPRLLQGPGTQREELDRISAGLAAFQPVSSRLLNYRKDGTELWLDLAIVPIADASGSYTHFVAVQRDVTESRVIDQQRRQSQHLESIGQLTGGVAHDFNNLLTVILGNAELIPARAPADRQLLGLASMITTAAEKAAAMIQRLLAFARRQPLEPCSVDVGELVAGMDDLLRRALGGNIQITQVRAPDLWPAQIDPGQLESAVLNLCINARDAMPDGGLLTVELSNIELDAGYAEAHEDVQPGGYVRVAVSDTGCGIHADQIGRVFEPFFSTKSQVGGTGLGLSMVYGFVKQSRGHVAIYSEPGEGTTVRMYLPRSDSAAETAPVQVAGEPVARGQETILMVEDDNLVRRFVHQQLRDLGYRVLVASSGPEAMPIVTSDAAIDLLFTDVVMPGGMTGRQLADAARTARPGLRVLFTTGFTESAIVHQGRLDPDARLLSKPYRRAELARRVRDSLDQEA